MDHRRVWDALHLSFQSSVVTTCHRFPEALEVLRSEEVTVCSLQTFRSHSADAYPRNRPSTLYYQLWAIQLSSDYLLNIFMSKRCMAASYHYATPDLQHRLGLVDEINHLPTFIGQLKWSMPIIHVFRAKSFPLPGGPSHLDCQVILWACCPELFSSYIPCVCMQVKY